MKRPRQTPRATSGVPSPAVPPVTEDLLDGLPMGIVLLEHDGTIRSVNTEGARLLGCRPDEAVGAAFPNLWRSLTGIEDTLTKDIIREVHRERKPRQPALVAIRRKHEIVCTAEWTCMPAPVGGVLGVAISMRDVSREQELAHERNRLASIADESPYPIVELDRHAQMVYANPAMTALLERHGYGTGGFPAVVPETLPDLVRRCLESGKPVRDCEVRLLVASFSWVFCPVQAEGHVRGYAVDLTQIHKAQRALEHSSEELQRNNRRLDRALQEAQAATKAKTAFLATISHELRTPMNGVIGMTSLLMDTSLTVEQRSYTDTIRQCGEALLHLINDVLECSKIEAGKLELETIDFNLRTTVEDVLRQFAERAESKELELTGLVHAAVPTALRGDPGRLRQVLTNLVGNAVKFTDRGEVTLQAYLEEESEKETIIRFEITDSGIGISPEVQHRLFQPFTQADSSMTRRFGGTGLGLSISKQLIELMGGRIGVTSAPQHGSIFWCTARFGKQPSSPAAILPTADLQGRRVLIVDDNESNRLILHHLVSGWGMQDTLVTDAEAALATVREAAARGEMFDCAILDVVMPGKDGLQLSAELQRIPEASGMRIVVMTSILQRGHADRARQVGARGYLTKPVRHDELRDCLRAVLGMALAAPSESTSVADPGPPLVTRHTLADHAARKAVLVVEDNAVNQRLAVRMLEKLGYRPDVVNNGQEALEALVEGRYDAVLMDCQMPIMDGFDATAAIRRNEQAGTKYSEGGHLPVIAVTANAMAGDRERCLAAGMDAYLAKPIKLDDVRALLDRWIRNQPHRDAGPVSAVGSGKPVGSERGVFNPDQMLQNIGGDRDLLMQLIGLFLDRQPDLLQDIRHALSVGDAVTVERLAHTLKGTAGNLCASEVALAAGRLEAVGHLGTLHDAPPVYAQLELEMLRLARALDQYRDGGEQTSCLAA
ncbi:MAG: response regulator [Nitrospira sp.]